MATQDITHLRSMMHDLTGRKQPGPSTIAEDNRAVIYMTAGKNKTFSTKTKHIAARWFYVADKVHDGTVVLRPCSTDFMLAGIFTKVTIPRQHFNYLKMHLVTVNAKTKASVARYVKHQKW